MKNKLNIGVVGLWHLGSVYSSCLAKLNHIVTGLDFDKKITSDLNQGIPPIYEPLLEETIKKHLNKNLFFTDLSSKLCSNKDYIFITFDLPVDDNDRVSTELIDKAYDMLSKSLSNKTTLIISSQVPLGTSRKLLAKLKFKIKKPIGVIYFPENLRLGKAFDSFLKPDRIIIGADSEKTTKKFIMDFPYFKCPILSMSLESAEMVKHALNTYLATCVSYSSEIADLSERLGANMIDVVSALKTDRRVSQFAPINPGLGFSGGTLGRDVQSLIKLGKNNHYETKLMKTVYSINLDRIPQLVEKIKSLVSLSSKSTVGILGLTYKPGTNTLRRSMSLSLADLLNKNNVSVKAFDPMIKDQIKTSSYIKICKTAEELFANTDIIILMTEWSEFLELPTNKYGKLMKKKIIIDTKNLLNSSKLIKEGFIYKGIGI